MLKLDGLSVSFGTKRAVRDLSLEIAEGELVCLLGPSGCGKTTTLRAIAGLERPAAGRVGIAGRVLSVAARVVPPPERGIGFLFQDVALFPHLTVAQNIAYGMCRRQRATDTGRVEALLDRVRMRHLADSYPHMLSGGEQQRAALVRALAPRPRVVLLDEPFSSLDAALRAGLREETVRILKDAGVTVLMVTHDPEEALVSADRIVLMRDGEMVQTGTPDELYAAPVDAFTAAFFGAVNRVPGTVAGAEIRTRLGALANPGFGDGEPVEVLIRPDGLRLAPGGGRASAELHVCSVHFAGASSVVRLSERHGDPGHDHFHARLPGLVRHRAGETVRIAIDPGQSFVFSEPRSRSAR
ncbi:MAG: ABC transporter ATP-binding protein [Defluviicoccus sp.]|nr:ABC transporter ATP-binding protein [Defluviicoccus sp.]MDE0385739.1 ABC transporter ATP-binding protein [Defluviicoccus sp.]